MEKTIVQVAADVDTVVDALGTLAPGWRDRSGIDHTRGWTTVPMSRASADGFAPMLADLMELGILLWTVDAEGCRVTLLRPRGSVLGPVDARDSESVDAFRREFEKTHVLVSHDVDKKALTAAAAASTASPSDRHRAFADLLGVPYIEPGSPSPANPAAPTLTAASAPLGTEKFRRRYRVVRARNILFFLSILTGLAFLGLVFQGPWQLSAAALAVTLVMLGVRLWLRLYLRRSDEDGGGTPS